MIQAETLYGDMPNLHDANQQLDEYGETARIMPVHGYSIENDLQYQATRVELRNKHGLPTLLEIATEHQLIPGTCAVVWEYGGTKIRIWAFQAVDDTHVKPIMRGGLPVGIELALKPQNYDSPEEFFAKTTKVLAEGINAINDLGIQFNALSNIYSQESSAVRGSDGYGIFLQPSESQAKRQEINGISNILIGKMIFPFLEKEGIQFVPGFANVDLNDGPAAMLDILGAKISDIGGTGHNINVAVRRNRGLYIVNLETGDLNSSFRLSIPEMAMEIEGKQKNRHLSELIMGGGNIGGVLNYLVGHMIQKHIIPAPYRLNEVLTAARFSDILDNNKEAFRSLIYKFNPDDKETWKILQEIALRIWLRSTDAEGTTLGAVINAHPSTFTEKNIIVAADGSKILRTPGYAELVSAVAETYVSPHTVQIQEAWGARGAAYAGLREYKQHHS